MDQMIGQAPQTGGSGEIQAMHTPDDVQAMLKLASLGWGSKRIAKELGCSRNTVRRYLRQGGYVGYRSRRAPASLPDWAAGLPFGICSTVATLTWSDRICGESWASK